jgi:hypothetical protein
MTNLKFKKWVKEMCDRADTEHIRYNCDVMVHNNITVCVHSNGKVGIARCHPDDIFDYDIGTAIAYARCKGYEIPKQTTHKNFSEMKYGDTFKFSTGREFTFIGKNPKLTDMVLVMDNLTYNVFNEIDCNYKYEMVD